MISYRCNEEHCNLVFDRPSKLYRHKLLHVGIKTYRCTFPNCSKSYSTPSHLKRHVKTTHRFSKEPIIYECPVSDCSLLFYTKWGLLRHERKHKSKPYCKSCDCFFKNDITYEKHMLLHKKKYSSGNGNSEEIQNLKKLKESPRSANNSDKFALEIDSYDCAKCSSSFKNKSNLRSHIIGCFNLKPQLFFCNYSCTKFFHYKRNLVQHVRIHHQLKTFQCSYPKCKKVFKHKKSLKHHLLTHSFNKEDICLSCEA